MKLSLSSSGAILALWLPSIASAFKNTSPFLLVSTSPFPESTKPLSSRVGTTSDFVDAATPILSQCSSDVYVLVRQPGLHARDIQSSRGMPHLRRELGKHEGRRLELEYAKGGEEGLVLDRLEGAIRSGCEAETVVVDASTGKFPSLDGEKRRVVRVEFPAVKGEVESNERVEMLKEHDAFLYSFLSVLPERHTLVFTTTPISTVPATEPTLRTQSASTWQAVKRSVSTAANPGVIRDNVIAKYQFFTEGILMAYLGIFVLLAILLGALNALTSLQVSYGAFEKDPAQQQSKKQQ